jgi:hypothetical protein
MAISAAIQPADRVPGHRHAVQAELVQQGGVDRGEAADRVQGLGAGGAAEPGVDGVEHPEVPGAGEPLAEAPGRVRAAAPVQQ